jgi:hypothetical protein
MTDDDYTSEAWGPYRKEGAVVSYDSRFDTLAHSRLVGELIGEIIHELIHRSYQHDLSKTLPPEVEVFDVVTPRLEKLTYGSEEYKASLEEMGDALLHHYAQNRHHPEYYDNGINDMTLIDLVEMFADWKAATERHADGDLAKSLVIQRERFVIDSQLFKILVNTALELRWIDEEPVITP